jgi:hypothetical protein
VRLEGVHKAGRKLLEQLKAIVSDVRPDIEKRRIGSPNDRRQPFLQQVPFSADGVVLIVQNAEAMQCQMKQSRVELMKQRASKYRSMDLADNSHWLFILRIMCSKRDMLPPKIGCQCKLKAG